MHVPEVVASNPGFVRGTRYELLQPDPRGDWGPRWLAVYEMDGEAAARTYAQRNDAPPAGAAHLHTGTRGLEADPDDVAHDLAAHGSVRHRQPATALHLHGRHECASRHGRGRAGGV